MAALLSATRIENIVNLLLWLLCQPGENTVMAAVPAGERLCCVRLCYGCCQERINASAVPIGSSSLLAGALPTLGSANSMHSEIQRDNWCHEQDQRYSC